MDLGDKAVLPQIKVTELLLLLPLHLRGKLDVLFYLVCRLIYAIYQVCSSCPAKPSVIPTVLPVAAQSQALCRFPLCRVGMPEGDWPKQLRKLRAGLPFPVRCQEDLCIGVLADSKRCF